MFHVKEVSNMDANVLGLSFLGILTLYAGYIGWSNQEVQPINLITPWGEDTGKTHQSQSKTGDASMVTEFRRRLAIQQVGCKAKQNLKESRTQFGSTTGALETYMLSSLCPLTCPSDAIYDGGNQGNEFCPILDDQGNGKVLDAGDRNVVVCGQRVCPSDMIFDGGNQANEFCPILDHQVSGTSLDAGNQNTKACGI
jgi:hypothetical protein